MIPGSNLYNMAITVVAAQPIVWKKYAGRGVSGSGKYIDQYETPITLYGSIQSVSRKMINQQGLDLNKNYKNFYSNTLIQDVERDRTGDRFIFDGRLWQAVGGTDWMAQDGWCSVMLVDIGPAPYVKVFSNVFNNVFG